MTKKIAVIGAGNGGQALAAYFAMNKQYEVRLFDYFADPVDAVQKQGYIELEGAVTGKGYIALASTDMGKVMTDADLIMVVNPAIYHNKIAKEMAEHIREGQIVFLSPSSVFGAFAFKKALEDAGCPLEAVSDGCKRIPSASVKIIILEAPIQAALAAPGGVQQPQGVLVKEGTKPGREGRQLGGN